MAEQAEQVDACFGSARLGTAEYGRQSNAGQSLLRRCRFRRGEAGVVRPVESRLCESGQCDAGRGRRSKAVHVVSGQRVAGRCRKGIVRRVLAERGNTTQGWNGKAGHGTSSHGESGRGRAGVAEYGRAGHREAAPVAAGGVLHVRPVHCGLRPGSVEQEWQSVVQHSSASPGMAGGACLCLASHGPAQLVRAKQERQSVARPRRARHG